MAQVKQFNKKTTTKSKVDRINKENKKEKLQKIHLAELVNIVIDYIRGDKTVEDMTEFGKKLSIRTYLPMMDKLKAMMVLIYNLNNSEMEQQEINVLSYERDKFFDVLLGQYAMIDVSDENLRTYQTYDLLYPVFAEYILQFCERDYKKFEDMVDRTLDIYRMKELSNLLDNIDYDELEKAINSNKSLLDELEKKKETVEKLRELYLKVNNDKTKDISANLQQMAIDKANEIVANKKGIELSEDKKLRNKESQELESKLEEMGKSTQEEDSN